MDLDYAEKNAGTIAALIGYLTVIAAAAIWLRKTACRFCMWVYHRFTF